MDDLFEPEFALELELSCSYREDWQLFDLVPETLGIEIPFLFGSRFSNSLDELFSVSSFSLFDMEMSLR